MADILTMQDLANGHLDIKALGEAANGDENTIVTTRTGNTYPSAERAINIMFQNGGLPAKPFPTKAKMTTEGASLADGQLAQVYNETANNGLYVKTDGAWVKANYDPLALAKADATDKANTAKAQAVADSKVYTDTEVTKVDVIKKSINSILTVVDGDGIKALDITAPFVAKADFKIHENGSIETPALISGVSRSLKYLYSVADDEGNILFGVNNAGQLVADFSRVPQALVDDSLKSVGYDAEVNHIFNYGQSLSVGQATPVISITQKYDNVMFTRGMRPQYDYPAETKEQWYASLVPAVEALSTKNTSLGETPSMGTGDAIKELILSEDGLVHTDMNYQIMLSASGYGATTIAQLRQGTTHYTRTIDQVSAAKSLAKLQNKIYKVQAVTWTQGESDALQGNTELYYKGMLDQLILDMNHDIKVKASQSKDVKFIGYQMSTHKVASQTVPAIALAQLSTSISNPLFYIATPTYHLDYQSTNEFHITSVSSRWLGAYYGLAYKRIVIDGEDWQPVRPLSSVKLDNFVNITFNVPHGKLVIDTTLVAENTNYGFELVTSAGAVLPITEVKVIAPDTVKIVSSAAIPVGAKVRYAWTGVNASGRISGPRGNLRDTQGDTIVFDPTGINKAMHNWCTIFEMEI